MDTLTPWRPFRDLDRLTHDIEEYFPRVFRRWPFEGTNGGNYFPPLESYLQNGDMVVKADLPGVDAKEVEISVLGNVLTIKGERKRNKEVKAQDYVKREVSYGSFERHIKLPEGVATDRIKAQFKDGVVEITMPIVKELAARKIPLEVEARK